MSLSWSSFYNFNFLYFFQVPLPRFLRNSGIKELFPALRQYQVEPKRLDVDASLYHLLPLFFLLSDYLYPISRPTSSDEMI